METAVGGAHTCSGSANLPGEISVSLWSLEFDRQHGFFVTLYERIAMKQEGARRRR